MRWLVVVAMLGCSHRKVPERLPKYDALSRDDFNRFAVRTNQPVFWVADANHDKRVDPDEIVALQLYPSADTWVSNGTFTRAFETAYNKIIAAWRETTRPTDLVPDPPDDPDGRARRKLVAGELDFARTVVVQTDVRSEAFVPHILAAAELVDQLYDVQVGAAGLTSRMPADLESRSLFRRDHGAACVSAKGRTNPLCSAIPGSPPQPVGVYPAALQLAPGWCATFSGRTLDPYSVELGATTIPYTHAYASEMHAIGKELIAAADALRGSPEAALEAYLRTAAASFESNDWAAADAAFARVTPATSKWYVRVGPDDVSWDPCKHKAGFHLTFARHDSTVYPWQIGGPEVYELILEAGEGRQALGARTVERAGGRAVVLANLFANAEATAIERMPVAEVVDSTAIGAADRDRREVGVLVATLREIAAAQPRKPVTGFNAELAPVLDELATQSAVLTVLARLRADHTIAEDLADRAAIAILISTVARMDELFDPAGVRRTTANPAGILVGMLVDHGVLVWSQAPAADTTPGSFSIHPERLAAASDAIAKTVDDIIAHGDRAAAKALVKRYADETIVPYGVIAYRFRIAARPNFVYSVIY